MESTKGKQTEAHGILHHAAGQGHGHRAAPTVQLHIWRVTLQPRLRHTLHAQLRPVHAARSARGAAQPAAAGAQCDLSVWSCDGADVTQLLLALILDNRASERHWVDAPAQLSMGHGDVCSRMKYWIVCIFDALQHLRLLPAQIVCMSVEVHDAVWIA